MSDKIRMLFMAASPPAPGFPALRTDREFSEIADAVRRGRLSDSFEMLQPRFASRLKEFQDTLYRERPGVFHFSGHGDPRGIILEDELGRAVPVDMDYLADLLRPLRGALRLVFLNTCYSQPPTESLRGMADYVVGTDGAIGDGAAITSAASFYNALSNGLAVAEAVGAAGVPVGVHHPREATRLTLLARDGLDPRQPFAPAMPGREPPAPGSASAGPVTFATHVTNSTNTNVNNVAGNMTVRNDGRRDD